MTRLNVEQGTYANPRFKAFVRKIKPEEITPERAAMGALIEFWMSAITYYGDGRKPVPLDVFDLMNLPSLEEVGLAVRNEDGVHSPGAEEFFEWYAVRRESAVKAGQKSAAVRRKKYGSAIPKNAPYNSQENSNTESNEDRTTDRTTFDSKSNARQPNSNAPTPIHSSKEEYAEEVVIDDGPRKLFELWKTICPDKTVVRLSSSLRAKMKTRLKEMPDLEQWRICFQNIRDSEWAYSASNIDLHWLMKNDDNYTKALSGKYNKDKPAAPVVATNNYFDPARDLR